MHIFLYMLIFSYSTCKQGKFVLGVNILEGVDITRTKKFSQLCFQCFPCFNALFLTHVHIDYIHNTLRTTCCGIRE